MYFSSLKERKTSFVLQKQIVVNQEADGLFICKFNFFEHEGKISLGGSEVVKEFTRIVKISSGLLEDWT